MSTRAWLSAMHLQFSAGVFWCVWGVKGFWWGALYGLFWEPWLGYRLAQWLLR